MNAWLIAAAVLVIALVPCGLLLARAPIMDALVALQLATSISILVLALVAMGLHRPSFLDIALALALLAYPASLLFAHFLERWL
ncbi:MAG TPA: monovalent cation/H+ antiporter complex subunit F [Chthoniobacterales bacterium]|jgi:multicomponent Na+:H+ antiporter subunit F|nr:monovalent cation/H+ antiporter complex subunit F [Chthoniobacterales bacterium]